MAGAALALSVASAAGAQEDSGFSLTISPARLDVVPANGESTQRVRVSNTGTESLHVQVSIREFSQLENGQIVFESEADAFSASRWLEVTPLAFDLNAGDERRVRIEVAVPDDAEPGEREVAVLFTVEAEETEGNIRLNRTIASQLLIKAAGEVIEEAAFGDLEAPGFADAGPIPLTLEVRNLGNIHRDYIEPDHLVARTSTGDSVAFPPFTVLGESRRVVQTQWVDPPFACICTVTLVSDDGQGNTITTSTRIIVFPLRFAIGILITAVGLFLMTRGGIRRRRKGVEDKIEQARREAYEEARREALEKDGAEDAMRAP